MKITTQYSPGFALLVLIACLPCGSFPLRAADPPALVTLDQGWDDDLKERFYFTPQGSRMIPLVWFLAIETKEGLLFADTPNLQRFGFLPVEKATPRNPYGLPIGFAVDRVHIPGRGVSLGLTCAACHTGDVTVNGQRIRIDGGPANLDFDTFYAELAEATHYTCFNADAFARFANRVIPQADALTIAQLRLEFADYQSALAGDAVIRASALHSGFGRVDALTQILNALSVVSQKEPSNLQAVEAPTSYPPVWLAPQLEFVQWNPIASSPIARNAGEALGVFGTANLYGPKEHQGESSVLLKELHALEKWIEVLKPPQWDPAIMGPIDQTRATTGKALFDQHCLHCHNTAPYRMTDPARNLFGKTFIEIARVNYKSVGTDPRYIEALLDRTIRTNDATRDANDGKSIVPALSFFLNAVSPIVRRSMDELNLTREERIEMSGFRLRPPAVPGGAPLPYSPPSFDGLKAGPLAGIWATGPFLHNGSVPTVFDLLSPENERPKVFWTGGRELDREHLGFLSEDAPGKFRLDTSLPGNGNFGHVYPAEGLTTDQRLAIIEYLKTL